MAAVKVAEKKTNYQFKLLYALGMIFIVAGHAKGGGVSLFYEWLSPYAFHLGLFIFASGYFYKNRYDDEPAYKYIWKKIKRLLIPLFIWNVFYGLLVWFLSTKGFTIGMPITPEKFFITPITTGHQFSLNLGGWFIIPLFMVQVWNILFRKIVLRKLKPSTKSIVVAVVYLVLGLLGVFLAKKGLKSGWGLVLTRFLFFLPFYGAGMLYKNCLEKHDHLKNLPYFGIILASLIVILCIFNKIPYYTPSWMRGNSSLIFMPFLVGFLGVAFWLRVSRILTPVVGRSKLVNLVADSSYSIMINQYLGFMLVNTVFAVMSKFITLTPTFNWKLYKSKVAYKYLPNNNSHFLILYLIAGIAVPILIRKVLMLVAHKCKKKIQRT